MPILLEHDWYPRGIPGNVALGEDVYLDSAYGFAAFHSERDPGASMIIAELCNLAGLPKGVLNIVNGTVDTVNAICDDARIKAISFVGSDRAGAHIYHRGTRNGKRVQANLGAKNHAILMPDANKEHALNSIGGAAFGAAGQRCMALS